MQRMDWWLPEIRGVGAGKIDEGVKRHKLPVIRLISHGNIMYSMMTLMMLYYLKVAMRINLAVLITIHIQKM